MSLGGIPPPQPSVDGTLVPELEDLACGPSTPSLWTTVESMLQGPAEADFVKDTVGPSLLRDVESAREELRSLLSILSDLRDSHGGGGAANYNSSSGPGSPPNTSGLRPHPPTVGGGGGVSLLQQRLKSLLENAKEPMDALGSQREKLVAQYVLSGSQRPPSAGIGKRPSTRGSLASRGSNRPTSSTGSNGGRPAIGARPSTASSGGTSSSQFFDPNADLQPIKAKLRFDKVHEIKSDLQELFKNEKDLLVADTDFIREAIEEEMTWTRFSQPTQKELTEMTSKLEEKEQQDEHERTISSLPTAGARSGSAANLLRHRSLPSLAQQQEAPSTSSPGTTPQKAAQLAPLRVAAPKPVAPPKF